jgi:hypothetical protein
MGLAGLPPSEVKVVEAMQLVVLDASTVSQILIQYPNKEYLFDSISNLPPFSCLVNFFNICNSNISAMESWFKFKKHVNRKNKKANRYISKLDFSNGCDKQPYERATTVSPNNRH